jgi:hypothetical protein
VEEAEKARPDDQRLTVVCQQTAVRVDTLGDVAFFPTGSATVQTNIFH